MIQDSLKKYQKETRLINLYTANIFGLLFFIPVIFLYGGAFYLIWGKQDYIAQMKGHSISFAMVVLFVAVGGIVLHELIHGATWAFFAKRGFRSGEVIPSWRL